MPRRALISCRVGGWEFRARVRVRVRVRVAVGIRVRVGVRVRRLQDEPHESGPEQDPHERKVGVRALLQVALQVAGIEVREGHQPAGTGELRRAPQQTEAARQRGGVAAAGLTFAVRAG
jgi:hypothetical protein